MLSGLERGPLVLADISGYTAFLAGSELDHATDVLADLTDAVTHALAPPLTFSDLEGDAVFCFGIGEAVDGSGLLDSIENAYFTFRRRLDAVDRATTCDCNACVLIPRLDLKVIGHYGTFARRQVGSKDQLTGSDVIAAHRLLKNEVAEVVKHRGYAFLTDALVAASGLDPAVLGMTPHVETYDDVGEIGGWVLDLHRRWAEEQDKRRVRIDAAEAMIDMSFSIPASRPVTWNYLTDPSLRPTWQAGTIRVDETPANGRRGAGTSNHCVHGKNATLEEILDWRPFDYYTVESRPPIFGLGATIYTVELADDGDGTTMWLRVAPPLSRSGRLMLKAVGSMYRKRWHQSIDALVAHLKPASVVADEPA